MAQQLSCPTCDRRIEWSEAYPYRPFCSERCRLIDLGDWLTEKNAIPGETLGPEEAGEAGERSGPEGDAPGGGTHGRA